MTTRTTNSGGGTRRRNSPCDRLPSHRLIIEELPRSAVRKGGFCFYKKGERRTSECLPLANRRNLTEDCRHSKPQNIVGVHREAPHGRLRSEDETEALHDRRDGKTTRAKRWAHNDKSNFTSPQISNTHASLLLSVSSQPHNSQSEITFLNRHLFAFQPYQTKQENLY